MNPSPDALPARLGYRMPAEWVPHAATWMAWPHNRSDWPGRFAAVPFVYADILRHLARGERVEMIVQNATEEASAEKLLARCSLPLDNLRFHRWPTNRVWTRDSGAIFLRRDSPPDSIAATDWRFNAWAKYPDWKRDDAIASRMARALRVPVFQPSLVSCPTRRERQRGGSGPRSAAGEGGARRGLRRIVLEGGSIDVNGEGVLLATEECLLGACQQRNPGVGREQLEQVFADYLGATQVVWLGRGIAGDDTHGHVDDIARFLAPDVIVAAVEPRPSDQNHQPLANNLRRLRAARDLHGKPFRIVELPLPSPLVYRGQRLPASYANFYIANAAVLVPTFNDPNDRRALNILAELFTTRDVVGIHCGDFIWGLGAIHCMTQQQPAP